MRKGLVLGIVCSVAEALTVGSGFAPETARADEEGAKPVVPLPGRDVVRPMKPDWCANAAIDEAFIKDTFDKGTSFLAARGVRRVQRAVDNRWDDETLHLISELACAAPDDADVQGSVARFRQGYINLVGTSEADDRLAQKARVSPEWKKQKSAYCESLRPDAEASPEEKATFEALAAGTGCEMSGQGGMALNVYADGTNQTLGWWVDQRAEVSSEIVRAVYVTRCLRILRDNADWPDGKNGRVMAGYAACGPDARRLSREKLDKELADPKFNDFARVNAREVFQQAKAIADGLTAEYKKMGAKDDAYQKLLFDAPEKGWTDWEAAYAANKDAFEAARAYETKFYGPSRKALQGCGASLRKNFNAYVRSRKPTTVTEAKAAGLDQIGQVLLASLALCDAVEGRLQFAQSYVNLLQGEGRRAPQTWRGPRIASYNAALGALSDILADRDKFPVKEFYLPFQTPKELLVDGAFDLFANKVLFAADARGQIASVAKEGENYKVSFKPATTMVWNYICKDNNRIMAISAGGQIQYGADCTLGTPAKIPHTTKEEPLTVPAVVGEVLKAGQTATFSINRRGEPKTMRDGLPKEVYSGADLKKLVMWFGVPL